MLSCRTHCSPAKGLMSNLVCKDKALGKPSMPSDVMEKFTATSSLLSCSLRPHIMVRGTFDGVLRCKTIFCADQRVLGGR